MVGTTYQENLIPPRPWKKEGTILYDANGKIIANVLEGWTNDYAAAYATGYNEALRGVVVEQMEEENANRDTE